MATYQPRASNRHKISLPGQVRVTDGNAVACDILDLSVGGAKIEVSASFRDGTPVLLKIGSLDEVPAKVIWSRDRRVGLQFADDAATMADLLTALALHG